jgi:hypothetical protein
MEYQKIKQMYAERGFPFKEAPYDLNLCGLRNSDIDTVNQFNDRLVVAYTDSFGMNQCLSFQNTTKPGLYYLGPDRVGNPEGTAILIPGFYPNVYSVGIHNPGKPTAHKALLQSVNGVFKVWRDNDRDGCLDLKGKIYSNVRGLNLHRASINFTPVVGPYSAACQVNQHNREHEIVIALAERYFELFKPLLSYALIQL